MESPEHQPAVVGDVGIGNLAVQNSKNLERFFKTWTYSLLNLREDRVLKLTQQPPENVRQCEEANFEAAKIWLQNNDHDTAWRHIQIAFSKDPDNIHAWCNKGMYHLRKCPVELREAQEAREKMEALMREEGPMNEAKVETAYWLHQRDGSEETKKKAFQLISEVTTNSNLTPSQQLLYLHMLALDVRSSKCPTQKQKLKQIDAISCQMLRSENDEIKFEVLRSLLRVFGDIKCFTCIHTHLDGQLGGLNGRQFVEELMRLKGLLEVQFSSNDYGEVGRIFLSIALQTIDERDRLQVLQDGLKFAEMYPEGNDSRCNYAPKICANLIFNIWATKYCSENHEQAEREHRRQVNTSATDLRKFLAMHYWPTEPDLSQPNRDLLNKAKMYLEVFRGNTREFDDVNYPRVLALLGEPDQYIQDAFKESLEHCFREREKVLAHKGLYLEHKQNWVESEKCFREALDIDGSNWIAKLGLQRVHLQMRR